MSLRLLLADLRSMRLTGLRLLLSQEKTRIEFIDEVTMVDALARKLFTGDFALVIAHHSLVPDISILPNNRFVLLVAQPDQSLFQAARERGALAYLSENPPEELLLATLNLKSGDFLIDPKFAVWALHEALRSAEPLPLFDALTPQERVIHALQEEGHSLSEIAIQLCIAKSTAKRHSATISRKRKLLQIM